ncbi:MAG: tetratricopeptide repeat protein [Luteibaculaceae bacterium]
MITQKWNKTSFPLFFPFFFALLLAASGCKTQEVAQKKEYSKKAETDPLTEAQRLQADHYFFTALRERAIGNMDGARDNFEKTLAIDPNNSTALYERARIADSRKEYFYALSLMEKAYKIEPNNFWINIFYADALAKVGQNKRAIAIYEKLAQTEDERIEFFFDWASLLAQEKKYKDAIKVLDKLEQRFGISEPLVMLKQQIYFTKGDNNAAINELVKLSDAFPDEIQYLGMLAELYSENKQPDKSKEYYDKILALDPNNGMVYIAKAEEARKAGDVDLFFSSLESAFRSGSIDLDTKIKILINLYSITESFKQDTHRVFPLLSALDSLYPKDPKTHSVIGDYLVRERKLEEARDRFRKALELDRSKEVIWGEVLLLNYQIGDFEGLVTDGKKAVTLFPTYPQFYFFYALGLFEQKDYEQAAEMLESGVDLVMSNKDLEVEFYSLLGTTYNKLERHTDSDKAYEKALKINPEDATVLNNYAYYLSLRRQELERAKEMSERSLKIRPNEASFLDTYGWIMFKMGNYNDALHFLLRAVEVDPNPSAEVLEHVGDTYIKLGNVEDAVKYWKMAKEKDDASPNIKEKIEKRAYIE